MTTEKISIAAVRNMMIAAQGLDRLPKRRAGKADVLDAIRRMGVLQIDTISVVARSPYLVLWSRLGDYEPRWLDELLAEGALFEYWSHAMCFLPTEDYRLYRRTMFDGLRGWKTVPEWLQTHSELVKQIMARIRREGGLRSAEFINEEHVGGPWWNWKDEKTALECLLITGELMVARREGFQRVYDLRSRVLPGWRDGPRRANVPSQDEVRDTLTLRAVEALGVTRAAWVPDYYRLPKTGNAQRLDALAEAGQIRRVEIEGLPGPAYRSLASLPANRGSVTTVLSPFDPLVWDRQRLRDLFNFDYTIEVYTPAAKRRFGYYTLPILHNGALVGRLDPKAHRALGQFEVKAVALEPGMEATDDLVAGLAEALRRLAAWHGTPELVVRRSEPADLAERIMKWTGG
jgi:uncharacterized protein YcaQ